MVDARDMVIQKQCSEGGGARCKPKKCVLGGWGKDRR